MGKPWQGRGGQRGVRLSDVQGTAGYLTYTLLYIPERSDPKAAPTDVRIRVLNSTAIALTWTRVHLDTIQGQLKEYRVSKTKSLWH